MARMYPDPISADTKSIAERMLYNCLQEQLDHTFVVLHSVAWITHNAPSGAHDGEADFIIAHPQHGVLVLEVKGGEIILDGKSDEWVSIDRNGIRHTIKDPFKQAKDNRYNLAMKLETSDLTRRSSYPIGYAVTFPEIGLSASLRPDAPREIVIDQSQVDGLENAVLDIFDFWRGEWKTKSPPGAAGIEALVQLMAPSWHLRSRLAHVLEDENRQIKQLTERQFLVLHVITRRSRRAAIVGGAGTGKTMLAIEQACALVADGLQVLFVCFNRNLADWLEGVIRLDERVGKKAFDEERIVVTTFHGLCGKAVHWAGIPLPLGPHDKDFYAHKLPDALLEAVDKMERRFDAIIVDEGQDLEEDWWISLEALLRDEQQSRFYVFFDDNQRIYDRLSHIPVSDTPFTLDINCRNTRSVHDLALPYSHATYATVCDGPEGRPVKVIEVSEGKTRDALNTVLRELVDEKDISPAHIVVLTPRSMAHSLWQEGDRLGTLMLTWNLDAKGKNSVRVSTIHSFKGLESPIVILTEMEHAHQDEVVYVGMSRARNDVIVIGQLPGPRGEEDNN